MGGELKAQYDKQEDIPQSIEDFRGLFIEKGGKWELTGIVGMQTDGNVARLETSLKKERDEHKETKAKLAVWGDYKHEDVVAKLDRIPELEAAAGGKLDDAKIDELANKRVEATLKSRLAPIERESAKVKKERDELAATVDEFKGKEVRRTIHDRTRAALTAAKVLAEAQEDALMLAERVFEVTEDGNVVTKEGSGVPQGLDPAAWLSEIQPKRPHWWPASSGGGARGSSGGGGFGGKNPFSAEHWNMTEQGKVLRDKGKEAAERLASAAGTTVGGAKPAAKVKAS